MHRLPRYGVVVISGDKQLGATHRDDLPAVSAVSDGTAALYIHIPFCEKRCSYCDFYTVADRHEAIPAYVASLVREMELYAGQPFWRQQQFSTLFFGGGTPSLLTPDQLHTLIESARENFTFCDQAEISMEANPGTTSAQHLVDFAQAGINRLSLGVQSFDAEELKKLDRIHTVQDVYRTVEQARRAGIGNLSVDLMFALPGQRPSVWRRNLEQAVALETEHISAYNLTVEPGTPLFFQIQKGQTRPLSEWKERTMFNFTIDYLAEQGYAQYEISNYARPGFHSRHNMKYWDGSAYLGLGASAHSFDGQRRWRNVENYVHYIRDLEQGQLARTGEEEVDMAKRKLEMIFLSLRVRTGLSLARWTELFGTEFRQEYRDILRLLMDGPKPLLCEQDGCIRLTREGLFICDSVCEQFVADQSISASA